MRTVIENIINQLREVQEANIWIGTNYTKKLDVVNEDEAFVRPHPELHSVAEIISHLTVWRKETILKIETGKGRITDDAKENWLDNNKLREIGWDKIRADYKNSLSELIQLLEMKEDAFLQEKYFDNDFKDYYAYRFVINGMLHHDLYHLGQLGIIIKFLKKNNKPQG